MKVQHAPETRRNPVWRYDLEHAVYDRAYEALTQRPDFGDLEKLWDVLSERFAYMESNPGKYKDLLYEMDLTELAEEAGLHEEEVRSHLFTMRGAGLLVAVDMYVEYNSVSVVIAPHMAPR